MRRLNWRIGWNDHLSFKPVRPLATVAANAKLKLLVNAVAILIVAEKKLMPLLRRIDSAVDAVKLKRLVFRRIVLLHFAHRSG